VHNCEGKGTNKLQLQQRVLLRMLTKVTQDKLEITIHTIEMTSAREGRCHFEKYVKYLDIFSNIPYLYSIMVVMLICE